MERIKFCPSCASAVPWEGASCPACAARQPGRTRRWPSLVPVALAGMFVAVAAVLLVARLVQGARSEAPDRAEARVEAPTLTGVQREALVALANALESGQAFPERALTPTYTVALQDLKQRLDEVGAGTPVSGRALTEALAAFGATADALREGPLRSKPEAADYWIDLKLFTGFLRDGNLAHALDIHARREKRFQGEEERRAK